MLRSVNNIVIAPAKTGSLVIKSTAVIATDHKNSGIRAKDWDPVLRPTIIVVKKLILPKIEDIPARCNLKIAKSTEIPVWNLLSERGGYTVHPVPAPASSNEDSKRKENDGINSQNLKLFIRGKAMSATPNINGISQFPNPPIEIGITIKKIITKACAVTTTLYRCSSPNQGPTVPSSKRIRRDKDKPINPAHTPKIK